AGLLLFAPVLPRCVGAAAGGAGESAAACRGGLPRSVGAASGVLRALLAVAGVAAVLALARGGVWGWTSALTLGCAGAALLLARPYPPYGMLAGALLAGAGLGALATGALAMGAAAAGRERLAAGVSAVECARLVGAAAGLAGAAALTMGGVPGEPGDAVLLACLAMTALPAAAAMWRLVVERRRRTVQTSLRAARQEVESLRGLLLELRAAFTEVRGQADRELVRLGLQDVPAPWVNPHGQE